MTTAYTNDQMTVMNALQNLYEAEGLKGLREMKKLHTEYISKCLFQEKEDALLNASSIEQRKAQKAALCYMKRFARESRWATKRSVKESKPIVKRGRPVDQAKRLLKKKEKFLKMMIRVAEVNRRIVKQSVKHLKSNKRADLLAAKKAEKANKPKGKPGRKHKQTLVVDNLDEGDDLIAVLLAKADKVNLEVKENSTPEVVVMTACTTDADSLD